MIKAAGADGDGNPLLLLGLSRANCDRLVAGQPIKIDMAKLGLPPGIVLLIGGETEDDVTEDFRVLGVPVRPKPPTS